MKVDAPISADMARAGAQAARLEALGYDGVRIAELEHDPFMPLAIAAEHTRKVELVTSVAVAFARNPLSMAHLAHDLNAFSGGRLVLGLGSQVRPHIERRFGMHWDKPAPQMREFLQAMHAIFDCWYDGARLDFDGEYYTHTLMPATFSPKNTAAGRPRISLSATGPFMTKVAGEMADGMIMHPFSTAQYIREVTLPAVRAGLDKRGRDLAGFELDYAPMIATGTDEQSLVRAVAAVRDRIAFYGCTVAYRPVLELHGWGALQDELIPLNRQHRKAEMAALVSDEILHTIAIVGEPDAVVDQMKARFEGLIGRTGFSAPGLPDDELSRLLARLRS